MTNAARPQTRRSFAVRIAALVAAIPHLILGVGVATAHAEDPIRLNSLSPSGGPLAGGNSVTITGALLTGAYKVDFGANQATSFTVVSDSEVIAIAPPATSVGEVTVAVYVPGGYTLDLPPADQYEYEDAPTVTSVAPGSGLSAGGATVTITGTNFLDAKSVTVGGTNATSFTEVSSTSITAVVPAGTGVADIVVTNRTGSSAISAADHYAYISPTVTGITPDTGPSAGGTPVVIQGSEFVNVTGVDFGTVPAIGYTVPGSGEIDVDAPAGTGTVDVTVTTVAGGTSATSDADQFTYIPPPTVTSIAPTSGPAAGGTSVTITGTGLEGVSTVKFGGTPSSSFTINSDTSITAQSPPGTGTVDVVVDGTDAASGTSAADQFTYIPAPRITALSPDHASAGGGTTLTITGTGFTGTTSVTFGGTAAVFTVTSDTTLTVTVPVGATGGANLTITTPGGNVSTIFTYDPAVLGTTGIDPTEGLLAALLLLLLGAGAIVVRRGILRRARAQE